MNSDRRTILSLIATGRITAAEAERLIAVSNEARETAWTIALCLAMACLAQIHLHELAAGLVHFLNAQLPALAEAMHQALAPMTDLGGLL